jgi:hypothetical protein
MSTVERAEWIDAKRLAMAEAHPQSRAIASYEVVRLAAAALR